MSELITQVPTLEELQAKKSHPVYGNVSQFFSETQGAYWGTDPQADQLLLTRLRDGLVHGEMSPEQGRNLFDMAQHIAEAELTDAAGEASGVVSGLIELARFYSRPLEFTAEDDPESNGIFYQSHRKMGLNFENLNQTAKALAKEAEKEEFEWKDRRDAYLLAFLHTGAHEAGHALLNGISIAAIKSDVSIRKKGLMASRVHIQKHPEMGITGDLEADVRTHEERFAEGYALLVLRNAFSTLGYSDEEVSKLLSMMTFRKDDEFSDEEVRQGALGYSRPLSQDDMVGELVELDGLIKDQRFGHQIIQLEYWKEQVEAYRDEGIVSEVKGGKPISAENSTVTRRGRVRAALGNLVSRASRRSTVQ